jgi:hypothetical protein
MSARSETRLLSLLLTEQFRGVQGQDEDGGEDRDDGDDDEKLDEGEGGGGVPHGEGYL